MYYNLKIPTHIDDILKWKVYDPFIYLKAEKFNPFQG
jgi:hypothetical protein